MSRPRSIRRCAGLFLLLAGLGTAAAAAPLTSPVDEEVVAASQPIPIPQELAILTSQERPDDTLPVAAPGMVRTDEGEIAKAENLATFLRRIVAGSDAADVLAMVSAAFRGSAGQLAWIPLGALCAGDDVCGLARLPDFTLLATGAGKPEAALAAAGAVVAGDPFDLRHSYRWDVASLPAGGGGGARPAEPQSLRVIVLEVLAIFGLDEVARTLWNMPPHFILLMLTLLLLGMVVIGRWVPARRHP